MKEYESSFYIYRNVKETARNYILSAFIAVGILRIVHLCLNFTLFYYIGGCFILISIIAPLITTWIPKERIVPGGKAVFITGCDRGFGYVVAQRLDDIGFQVFAGCLFPDGEGAKNLQKSGSNRLHVVSLDVTSDASVKEAVTYVEENINKNALWAVINNAGICLTGELPMLNAEILRKTFDVNTVGAYRVSTAFLPLLKKSKGRILNVSSLGGRYAVPWMVSYCMSKSALNAFSDGLRIEMYKWNIQVVNIEPTFYRTPMLDEQASLPSFMEKWNQASKNVRNLYGPAYIKRVEAALNNRLNCLDKVLREPEEVVVSIEDALTALHPEYCYRPGSFVVIFFYSILQILPKCFTDVAAFHFTN